MNRLDAFAEDNRCHARLLPSIAAISGTMARITAEVAAATIDVTVTELVGDDRCRRVSWPRQVAMAICHEVGAGSTTAIGRYFNRDHTTVIHAIRRVSEAMTPDLRDDMDEIKHRAGVRPPKNGQ